MYILYYKMNDLIHLKQLKNKQQLIKIQRSRLENSYNDRIALYENSYNDRIALYRKSILMYS